MKRLLLILVLTLVAAGLILAPVASASGKSQTCKVELLAGQYTHVGWLTVTHYWGDDCSPAKLKIKYEVDCPWIIKEVHLAVGHFVADIPVNKAGAAAPGKFPIADYPYKSFWEVTIPCHEKGAAPLVIAAHAVVSYGCEWEETAWAAGKACCPCGVSGEVLPFARGWAKYFSVTL